MKIIATSKSGVTIRLTDERWAHITEEHCELSGLRLEVLNTIRQPDFIIAGHHGEVLATREMEPKKFLVVVYREIDEDGFVITAFLTKRLNTLKQRRRVWP